MTLTEILPAVRQLPMLDKIRLLRILAEELDTTEDIFPFGHTRSTTCQLPTVCSAQAGH